MKVAVKLQPSSRCQTRSFLCRRPLASESALRQGVSLKWILSQLSAMQRPAAPLVLMSYLSKIGTSDAIDLAESVEALVLDFGISKLGRAMANYDPLELDRLNEKYLHRMSYAEAIKKIKQEEAKNRNEEPVSVGSKLRTQEKVGRVWFAPYIDSEGNQHSEKTIFVVDEEAKWVGQK